MQLCEEMADLKTLSQALTAVGGALQELGQDAAAQEVPRASFGSEGFHDRPTSACPPAQLASRSRTALAGP